MVHVWSVAEFPKLTADNKSTCFEWDLFFQPFLLLKLLLASYASSHCCAHNTLTALRRFVTADTLEQKITEIHQGALWKVEQERQAREARNAAQAAQEAES